MLGTRASSQAMVITAYMQEFKPADLTFSSNSLPFYMRLRQITQLSFSLKMRATDFWKALIIIKAASHHYSVDSLTVLTAQKTLRVPMHQTQTTHLRLTAPIRKSYLAKCF